MSLDLTKLKEPFAANDVEWRVMRSGKNERGIWAMVLCYMTSRAVQERLDDVCGPGNWQVKFERQGGALACAIGIRFGDEWIWKWDGSGLMEANDGLSVDEAGKGDYSQAMKRAAVQWGIGRYLYRLSEAWAVINQDGAHYGKTKDGDHFHWDPPALPAWALPGGTGKPDGTEKVDRQTGEIATAPKANGHKAPATDTSEWVCPTCAGAVYDNRKTKKGKQPDWKCRDKACDWAMWVPTAHKELEERLGTAAKAGAISPASIEIVLGNVMDGDLGAFRRAWDWLDSKTTEHATVQAGGELEF